MFYLTVLSTCIKAACNAEETLLYIYSSVNMRDEVVYGGYRLTCTILQTVYSPVNVQQMKFVVCDGTVLE